MQVQWLCFGEVDQCLVQVVCWLFVVVYEYEVVIVQYCVQCDDEGVDIGFLDDEVVDCFQYDVGQQCQCYGDWDYFVVEVCEDWLCYVVEQNDGCQCEGCFYVEVDVVVDYYDGYVYCDDVDWCVLFQQQQYVVEVYEGFV